MSTLRPPLPPPLSHEGICFILGHPRAGEIAPEVLAGIAAALSAELPPGDFDLSPSGTLAYSAEAEHPSLWLATGRIEALTRGVR